MPRAVPDPRELQRDLEDRGRPRPVVVDARTVRDAVKMRPNHQRRARVPGNRLGNDVECGDYRGLAGDRHPDRGA